MGSLHIRTLLELSNEKPFSIGRNGTIETEALYFWIIYRQGSAALDSNPYPQHVRATMERNAGVFPATDESLDAWAEEYVRSLGYIDGIAAGWYEPLKQVESFILDKYTSKKAERMPLRSLEPFYTSMKALRWSPLLSGKKVAVVSSFADTMRKQVHRLDAIWKGDMAGLFPPPDQVDWSFFRTGYSPVLAQGRAEWPGRPIIWQQAVISVVKQVSAVNPDIVLIGCGGLGMVIAACLRDAGISCIVLGGAIQVLFGIKGQRWASHPIISKFWNDAWVWPSEDETPRGAETVERSCYWGTSFPAINLSSPQDDANPDRK